MEFKDEVTAGDGAIRASAPGKGKLCAATSVFLFKYLEEKGVKTHLLGYDGDRRLVVRRLKIIPIEVIVRNYAYGSLLKRMPMYKQLQPLDPPLIEFHYKDDALHDPLILVDDILRTNIVTREQLDLIVDMTMKVNSELSKLFSSKKLTLVDAKFEFGFYNGEIYLADEISGDTIRVIDDQSRHLDKEVFRRSKSVDELLKAYSELALRLGILG